MDKEKQIELIETLQKAVEQMKIDDIEEQPDSALDYFQCQCCGEEKVLAGSVVYQDYHLCNNCVLIAETSFALNKIDNIEELIESMEDKRLENFCNLIIEEKGNINN